ncbi:MAG TPA: SbcC/MukB-like Walker B domain-containing protein [Spirochaetales bacterium]|nr:SbcC/MukB-like Walker B domain-containing protein [Spirochaetales bacterium]
MINLTAARLVNWHYFRDSTINIGSRTLISGDNGMGKSTIVDAIQYALAADLRKARFNQAAGDRRGGRDLLGYVRCKIGSDSTEYLRGDVVSHVMLQFDANGQRFTAAVCVEAYADSRCIEHFWMKDGVDISSVLVVDAKGKALSWRQFKDSMDGHGFENYESKREYMRSLTNRLGVFRRMSEYNPYLEAFTRSVSFTPLVSVDRFVCDYILEERTLNIQTMKDNLESYKEAERHARATRQKIDTLRKIRELADEYRKHLLNINRQDYLKRVVDCLLTQQKIDQSSARSADTEHRLAHIHGELERNAQDRAQLDSTLREVDAALARDDSHALYRSLRDRAASLDLELKSSQAKSDRCELLWKQCAVLLPASFVEQADGDREQAIDRALGILDAERSAAEADGYAARRALSETESALSEAAAELKDLEQGIRRYPENPQRLLEALRKQGMDAWILAELAEVTSPDWADAVEGWLNTLRFAIIVAPDSFQKALELYDAQPRSVGGVALPNIGKLYSRAENVREGSLAMVVSSDNPWASTYLKAILGDVMTADLANLKTYDKAITRECMSYSNHTAMRVREEVYRDHFLGRAGREQRIEFLGNELVRLRNERDAHAKRRMDADNRASIFARSIHSLYEAKSLAPALAEAARLREALSALKKELDAIDISQSLSLEKKRDELRLRLDALGRDRDSLNEEHGKAQSELARLAEDAFRWRGEEAEREQALDDFKRMHEAELGDCESYAAERLKAESAERISGNWIAARKGIETRAEKTLALYRKRAAEYNNQFNAMVSVEIEDFQALFAILERLEKSELPDYEERIIRARQDAEREFRDHFIAKLNEYIIEAKESFREINATLKTMSFGHDQYSFSLEERADRRGQIRIVQNAAQISAYDGGLFEQIVDPEERRETERLFNSIVDADLDSAELRAICDYRTYFTYDIRIRDTQSVDPATGRALELSLSRVLREKSGGESQTPYYVAIAASFYRFFKDKPEDTIRFVLFDEAFDKLDDERIRKVINFYHQMGIQLMVAVPPGKIEAIAPLADQISLVSRVGQHARIRDFRSSVGEGT